MLPDGTGFKLLACLHSRSLRDGLIQQLGPSPTDTARCTGPSHLISCCLLQAQWFYWSYLAVRFPLDCFQRFFVGALLLFVLRRVSCLVDLIRPWRQAVLLVDTLDPTLSVSASPSCCMLSVSVPYFDSVQQNMLSC